jgi:excisionase family DNA binding protein
MSRDRESAFTVEPLVVSPRIAWQMLGCGNTRGYELIAAGELESYRDGRSRKITVASIKAYVARRLAGARAREQAE